MKVVIVVIISVSVLLVLFQLAKVIADMLTSIIKIVMPVIVIIGCFVYYHINDLEGGLPYTDTEVNPKNDIQFEEKHNDEFILSTILESKPKLTPSQLERILEDYEIVIVSKERNNYQVNDLAYVNSGSRTEKLNEKVKLIKY